MNYENYDDLADDELRERAMYHRRGANLEEAKLIEEIICVRQQNKNSAIVKEQKQTIENNGLTKLLALIFFLAIATVILLNNTRLLQEITNVTIKFIPTPQATVQQ